MGIQLVAMRAAPHQGLADEICILAATNTDSPVVELMWELPGSMLACVHMGAMTGDARFKALFQAQAARLPGGLAGRRAKQPDHVPVPADAGLAVCLWDCVTGEPKFPTIDVL